MEKYRYIGIIISLIILFYILCSMIVAKNRIITEQQTLIAQKDSVIGLLVPYYITVSFQRNETGFKIILLDSLK